jgi:hypothetical protein
VADFDDSLSDASEPVCLRVCSGRLMS